jgi:hypothetical protein
MEQTLIIGTHPAVTFGADIRVKESVFANGGSGVISSLSLTVPTNSCSSTKIGKGTPNKPLIPR